MAGETGILNHQPLRLCPLEITSSLGPHMRDEACGWPPGTYLHCDIYLSCTDKLQEMNGIYSTDLLA